MNCPVCKTVELRISERQGVEIDFCPNCRGVWLDRGELDKLIERAASYEGSYSAGYERERDTDFQREKAKRGKMDVDLDLDLDDFGSRRREEYRRDDDRREDYRPDPRYQQQQRPHKKKSLLGEIFDIFD